MTKRLIWGNTSSDIKFILVLNSPDFTMCISSNILDVRVNKYPSCTDSNLVRNTISPIEIILTINHEYLSINSSFNEFLAILIYNISWVNWSWSCTNLNFSHPEFVITINSPRNLSSMKTELNHETRNSIPASSSEVGFIHSKSLPYLIKTINSINKILTNIKINKITFRCNSCPTSTFLVVWFETRS